MKKGSPENYVSQERPFPFAAKPLYKLIFLLLPTHDAVPLD